MSRTRIKICGITTPQDALAAADAGADAVGLVFHPPSRRNLSRAQAAEILAALPPMITAVGLFVDLPVEQVRSIATELHLSHVQLNGHESPQFVAELAGFCVVKAIHVAQKTFAEELRLWRGAVAPAGASPLRGLVLETAGQVGGSGIANDWDAVVAARAAGALDGLPPLIAAGGLQAETVGQVVRMLHPWGVDVSSGVESSPGRKSAEKIRRFIEAVRQAEI
jgi:phosphoribosylanthranilate isomerase